MIRELNINGRYLLSFRNLKESIRKGSATIFFQRYIEKAVSWIIDIDSNRTAKIPALVFGRKK
jgi:hypothetical protein